ncbi:MAG: ATP-grasp domain-containing protein [Candidatus Taylorbacteria bacterium]|nr:ATP-grasp domain-containing protein [Candidatus Taylorbacteria bacterium]
MKILILYNLATIVKKGDAKDLACEQEITIIVPVIADILRTNGHHVETIQASLDLWNELTRRKGTFDLVFNLAEGFGGANSNELFVPAMLEALEIPFTGPPFRTYVLAYDKGKANRLLSTFGVPIPKRMMLYPKQVRKKVDLRFPVIVKPVHEDASLGINYDSVVEDENTVYMRAEKVFELYRQPALVEEFVDGREISVGCLGNRPNIEVFPAVEFTFDKSVPILRRIRSYEYKWGGGTEAMEKAKLDPEIVTKLEGYTRTAFMELDCRDYARVDYRLTSKGEIFLLEVNCNPGIGPNTHGLNNTLTMMATFNGYSFESFIMRILEIACAR